LVSVCHLTSVHTRYDSRIFLKECRSLVGGGYDVGLIVADGLGDEVKDGVSIVDVGRAENRFRRMTGTVNDIYKKALEINAALYHFHDPELIPVGIKLRKNGKIVIFDAHEDLPRQILGKPYLNEYIKKIISISFTFYERWKCPAFDAIVTATPYIRDKFLAINPSSLDINNFPILGELSKPHNWPEKKQEIAYVGGISKIRGIHELVQAMDFTQGVRLNLVGNFSTEQLREEAMSQPGWSSVNELGFLDRSEVTSLLAESRAGLVTFLPVLNHIDSQPNKMFEYMSAGLPVIASSFPLWREIVEGNQCGVCVNPLEPGAIGKAIQHLVNHPEEAEKMGNNGRDAVENKYNWSIEEQKLLNLYKTLLN